MMKVFTLKMGTIQTGLAVGFGHRPLNKLPLQQGENDHSEPTVSIHRTENRMVAGEAGDEEARQNQEAAALVLVRLGPRSTDAPQPHVSVTRVRSVHERGRSSGSARSGLLAPPTRAEGCARSLGRTCT